MSPSRLDQIILRERHRSARDIGFACALAVLLTLGLGALASSARGAGFPLVTPIVALR